MGGLMVTASPNEWSGSSTRLLLQRSYAENTMKFVTSYRRGLYFLSVRAFSKECSFRSLVRRAMSTTNFLGQLQNQESLSDNQHNWADDALSTSSQRKHDLPMDILKYRTSEMISALKGDDAEVLERLVHDDCFELLEAWMEIAMSEGGLEAPRRAAELLEALEDHGIQKAALNRPNALLPNESMFNVVLHAHAVCRGGAVAAQEAAQIVQRMLNRKQVAPSSKTFNILLNCWAKSADKDAGKRAEEIIEMMKSLGLKITDVTIIAWMESWSRNGDRASAKYVVDILNRIIDEYQHGDYDVKPSIVMVNIAIQALTCSKGDREGAREAEELVNRIRRLHSASALPEDVVPDTRTYTQLMVAWSQCESREGTGDAANRAESILQRMIEQYRKGVDVKPNSFAFLSCITAWSRCVDIPEAPRRAENLLDQMISLFKESDFDPDFKPSIHSANAIITAWARSSKANNPVQNGLRLLEKMKEYAKADVVSYSGLLDIMAKRGMSHSAIELIEWMEGEAEAGLSDVIPDRTAYNSVLAALAAVGDARKADEILAKMKKLDLDGRPDIAPCRVSYTSYMNAWSRSDEPNRLQHVKSIFDEMLHLFRVEKNVRVKPDVFAITVLLKTCSNATGTELEKRKALEIAMDAVKLFDDPEVGPINHVACATIVNTIHNLMDDSPAKTEYLSEVLSMILTTGNLSRLVLKALYRGAPQLVPQRLQKEWFANVPHRSRPRFDEYRA